MSTLERYVEWLERLEIPESDRLLIAANQLTLLEALGRLPNPITNIAIQQLQALQNTFRYETTRLAELGIKPVVAAFTIGPPLRWTIKDKPGLWSTASIIDQFNLRPRLGPSVYEL
jgi:hypothetical protein